MDSDGWQDELGFGGTLEDALLNENHRKAQLSYGYLHAIASVLGYKFQKDAEPDVYSVDARINAGGDMMPQVEVQLKATSSPLWRKGGLRFRLLRKNYDDMRKRRMIPIILAVLVLPKDPSVWLSWSEDEIAMRGRMWWVSLRGYPSINTKSKTISLPENQIINLESLPELMELVRRGELSRG